MNASDKKEGIRELSKEIGRRISEPRDNSTYVLYFVVVIMGFAAIGGWIPILIMLRNGSFGDNGADLVSTLQAVSTYAIAISATAFVDFVIALNDPDTARRPFSKPLPIFLMGAFVLVCVCTAWSFTDIAHWKIIILTILGMVMSWLVWWISNADNSNLGMRPPDPTAPMGGNPDQPMSGDDAVLENEGLN